MINLPSSTGDKNIDLRNSRELIQLVLRALKSNKSHKSYTVRDFIYDEELTFHKVSFRFKELLNKIVEKLVKFFIELHFILSNLTQMKKAVAIPPPTRAKHCCDLNLTARLIPSPTFTSA